MDQYAHDADLLDLDWSAPMTISRRPLLLGAAVAAGTLAATALPASAASAAGASRSGPKPTVVLVHGAFADASSWSAVASRLQKAGYPVVAPANPLRGLIKDGAYLTALLATIEGPKVVVGHSYGGAVISQATAGDASVKALVYVAAFMPDKGEQLGELAARFPGSQLGDALQPLPDGAGGTDLAIQTAKFHAVFTADLPVATSALMGASQRPISAAAFTDAATAAAWRDIPSWAVVAAQDRAIAPDLERFEAKRAGSHTTVVDSSHVAMVSHPDLVTKVVKSAAAATC
ncbi:alpha/beta fold hydrolase [Streptomyces sp. NPDC090083]|uniref:alpha/beta fold hydrolase n=1 Tax=Streptomyces sp. NPDC090083 TaxID=3365941 RepID=UPI003809B459